MISSLDPNIQFRILIVDSDTKSSARIRRELLQLNGTAKVNVASADSIPEAYRALSESDPNVVLIDPIATGIRDSVTFIQHVRTFHPTIVFVLCCTTSELHLQEAELYSGWGTRLKHYFLLPKETSEDRLCDVIVFNLMRVQLDLYAYGAQESLSRAEQIDISAGLSYVQLSKLKSQINQLSRDLSALVERQATPDAEEHSGRAFVIIAYTDDMKDVFQLGIKDHIGHEFNLEAYRIDEHYQTGLIIQQIYEEIHRSRLVIAELTHPRPNCYYELGFAEALNKPVIRIARSGTPIHFDVNQYQIIFYGSLVELRDRLTSALGELGISRA